jgi:hypothetical protein
MRHSTSNEPLRSRCAIKLVFLTYFREGHRKKILLLLVVLLLLLLLLPFIRLVLFSVLLVLSTNACPSSALIVPVSLLLPQVLQAKCHRLQGGGKIRLLFLSYSTCR